MAKEIELVEAIDDAYGVSYDVMIDGEPSQLEVYFYMDRGWIEDRLRGKAHDLSTVSLDGAMRILADLVENDWSQE